MSLNKLTNIDPVSTTMSEVSILINSCKVSGGFNSELSLATIISIGIWKWKISQKELTLCTKFRQRVSMMTMETLQSKESFFLEMTEWASVLTSCTMTEKRQDRQENGIYWFIKGTWKMAYFMDNGTIKALRMMFSTLEQWKWSQNEHNDFKEWFCIQICNNIWSF